MSEAFVGEIRAFGFNFAPREWAACNGQLLPIAQYTTLYAILGTTYGGDGVTTYGLPDLRGRVPMHWGSFQGFNTVIGEQQGTPQVTLTVANNPAHTHTMTIGLIPSGGVVLRTPTATTTTYVSNVSPNLAYVTSPSAFDAPFSPNVISSVGGSQPHDNMQPYLAINFCISLFGIFPSQN